MYHAVFTTLVVSNTSSNDVCIIDVNKWKILNKTPFEQIQNAHA
jgi:hypothetical protein